MIRNIARWVVPFLSGLLAAQGPITKPRTLAITHATIIDATGGPVLPDSTVLIVGDRIADIGSSHTLRIPKGAEVLDGTGKFLIPGLWDMHVHLDHVEYLPLFIANGVTGVRVMWGDPDHQRWRKDIATGKLVGPRMMIGSPIIDGPNPYWPRSVSVATVAQAREAVAKAKRDGADFVKILQFLPRDLYFAIADESKKQEIPFEGHLPVALSAEEASRAGQKSFEHLIGVLPACSTHSAALLLAAQAKLAEAQPGSLKFEELHDSASGEEMLDSFSAEKAVALAAVLKSNGTWQCPTLTLLHMFAYGDDPALPSDPRLKYMPPRMKSYWDPSRLDGKRATADFIFSRKEFQKDLEVVGILEKSGVGILAGTDAQNPYCFYGFSLHDELGFLVQAGLTPMQALQAATLNPARFFHKGKDLGTLEKGKIADLVLLNANPLDSIANTRRIDAVVYGGKVYARAELDQMLARVEALAGRKLIGLVLLQTIQDKGIAAAVTQYDELRATQPDAYDFSEQELIGLGYQLLGAKKNKEAIEIFKLSVEAYPASYNTYDSLAEAYMDDGDTELAIENYRQSLQLNPDNANGARMLRKLTAH